MNAQTILNNLNTAKAEAETGVPSQDQKEHDFAVAVLVDINAAINKCDEYIG